MNKPSNNPVVNLALDTIRINKQALVFVNTRKSAEKEAEEIAKHIKTVDVKYHETAEKLLKALSRPTRQCKRLAKCMEKGIVFHHSGLAQKQKDIIETEFRKGSIKIICCTPTLAMGVDLPAFRVIIRDLKRFGHHGLQWIPVLEYMQQAGRAGRPSFDTFGEAIAIAKSESEKETIEDKYVHGEPEPIYSKLAVEPVFRTYLLSLIAVNFVNDKKSILNFFSKTFWAYQFKDMNKLQYIIDKMLSTLEEWEFIETTGKADFVSALKLDNVKVKATLLGQRVAQLYIDPLTAHYMIDCLRRGAAKQLSAFSFLQMVCYTLEMRPLLRVKVKEYDTLNEDYAEYVDSILSNEPSIYDPDYDDYLSSIKTALFMQDWMDEHDEEDLLEKYSITPGEIRVKLDVADWLLYSSSELSKLLALQDMIKHVNKTRFRLRYGVKEELLPLLKLKNIGRVRARKLFRSGIKDLGDVKKASVTTLAQILGASVAKDIKEQLGQEVEEIKPTKRKGQMSLGKY